MQVTGLDAQGYEGIYGPYVILSVPSLGQMYATDFAVVITKITVQCEFEQEPEQLELSLDQVESGLSVQLYRPECTPADFKYNIFSSLTAYFDEVKQSDLI